MTPPLVWFENHARYWPAYNAQFTLKLREIYPIIYSENNSQICHLTIMHDDDIRRRRRARTKRKTQDDNARRLLMIKTHDDMYTTTRDNARRRNATSMKKRRTTRNVTTTHDDDVQWRHATTNDSVWRQRWLLSVEPIIIRYAILLILANYDFNLNDMQSTVILITCQSESMAPKRRRRNVTYPANINWFHTTARNS